MSMKRILSMVLCLSMVLSCFPAMSVFAEEAAVVSAEKTVRIEAENAAYNIYANNADAYSGASGGVMVGGAPGTPTYASWDDADSTEDLVNGFIDKSNDPYVVFYVDAPAAGTYKLSTASRFYLNTACDNAYAAILVNPSKKIEDPSATVAYQAHYGAVAAAAGTYKASEAVEVQLVEGRNVIFVTPVTYEQDVKWATVDYLDITGDYAVEQAAVDAQTLYAGDAPYIYGYTTKNAGGTIGGGSWGGDMDTSNGQAVNKTRPISEMNAANARTLRGFTYTVNAPEDGYYDITVSFASMKSGDDAKAIGFLVDGVAQAREFAFTNGSNTIKGYIDLSVYLTEGDHVLTITAAANRTSAETATNSDWCDYAELLLYGGLTQSVIQSNPNLTWWYAEAEYQEQGYTVWHNYSTIETNHNNTYRDYNNANYGAYQSKSAVGGGSAANNYTLAQLQEGRLDKTTTTGVSVYVEAEEAGSYDFYAYYRLNCPGIWGTITPYGVFMVNGEFGAQAMNNAGGKDWSYNTETVQLNLQKGLNEITFIPMTKDQYVSASDWASVDCIFVDTDLQVKKVPTGSVTYTPEQGIANLYTKIDSDGTIGYDKRTAVNHYNVKASTLTHDMLHTVPFMAYTVEAPYDGYYNISLAYKSNGVTAQNYAIAVLVDEGTKAEVKHLVTDTTGTADVSTYLTAGTHTVAFTLALPISADHEGTVLWCNLGNITMEGGLVLADAQINPLYYGMSVLEAETDAFINRHNPDTMKQASTYASGGYDIGNAYSSTQSVADVKQHMDPSAQAYVEYMVEAEQAGEYTLMVGVRGQFSVGNKILMQVNGTVYEQECYFDNNVNCHQPITVSLEKGMNTVRVLAATNDIGWVNQDCLGLSAGLTGHKNSDALIQETDKLANMGNYNYKVDDGRYWGSDGLDNSIISSISLAELSEDTFLDTSWYSVTVEAPAAGWYGVQANVWIPTVETAQLGKLGVLANGTAYEAKLWQDSSAATRAEAFVYLNEGINDIIFTGILADSNVAAHSNGDNWMDADYIVLSGGVTVAETQRYPVQGLILGSAYTEENGVVTVPAGSTEDEIKSNFYNNATDGYEIVYDETKTVKSMGASQILALGNPVGRVLNYRNAVFMESSASGFTVSGELEGDVTITVRAEEGRNNGGTACLYVETDGVVSEYAFPVCGGTQQITIASGLSKGNHTIKVTKGTDAKYDMIYVYSVTYTGTLTETAPADMAIEFLGDSITVGYGLYEEDVTLKDAMSGSYYSYANVAADILNADHYVIGNGAWRFGENTGAEGDTRYLGYIYEKNSMNLNLGAYDFAWQPDVIVINLGTNDANQYTFTGTDADQEIWSADMAALLTMVREHNPNAEIYWVYGAMEDVTTNAAKDVVVPLIQNAIDAYNTANGDDVTYVHVTNDNAGVYDHPTREGHIVIGEEVASAISGSYTNRLEAESDSIYWRYTAIESGATNDAVGGVQPGTDANMQSYTDLTGGAELKKTEHPMISFMVDVESEGDYTLDVAYRAGMKTGSINDYFIVVGVDDAAYTKTQYVSAHPNNANWTLGQATVHLTAGRHTIRMITMLADTRSESLYTNWINIDYVDVTGCSKVTAVAPNWTHLQAGDAEIYNNFATPGNTDLASYGDWYASILGGYRGDSTGAGLTVDNFTIYELAKLGYFSYTVEVPADGFYDLQTYIRCYNDYAHFRNGHIMLAVDDQVHWFPAEYGYSVLKWNAQNLSVYLTEGTHVLTVSGIVGDIGTCAKDWCDMGALSVSGGITLADTQIDPLSLIQKVDTVYVDAANGKDVNAGTQAAPVKTLERALKIIAANGTIHIVGDYTVSADFAWTAAEGAITVTGGKLDFSAQSLVDINSPVTFESMNLVFADNAEIYCNGNKTKIAETVTVTGVPLIFGGADTEELASTDLTVLAGTYQSIYGGSGGVAGATTKITGEAKLVVGGNVNSDIDAFSHDLAYNIYGGSRRGTVGSTNVTVNDNVKANKVYGGGSSSQTSSDWCDFGTANVTINGGSFMGIYGGNPYGPSAANSKVVMTINGGTVEQIFGAHELAHDCKITSVEMHLKGGTILRRVYGGCYNNYTMLGGWTSSRHVVGNINVYIYSGVNIACTYSGSDLGVYAHSRYSGSPDPFTDENTAIYFIGQAAYDASYSKLTAQDSATQAIMGSTSAADNIYTANVAVTSADGTVVYYTDLQTAADACGEGQYVKLVDDVSDVNVTLAQDLYIDLNGNSLSGTITAGEYKVYGMDTTTDKYVTSTGSFSCGVTPVKEFKTEITGAIRRYMAVQAEDGSYSFNRFYLGITHTSLKPGATGVGYKGIFGGSDVVKGQIASFGYSLQLDGGNVYSATKEGSEFISGREYSLLLKNYDIENFGAAKLYANTIITLSDGTVIESARYETTMKDMVESINANIDDYSAAQILAVQQMLTDCYVDWNIENIMSYTA